MNWFKKSVSPPPLVDSIEEHRISIPGIELAFNHATRTVFMVDQTGTKDTQALADLEQWYTKNGWFFHCVVVSPPPPGMKSGEIEMGPE